jgi:hypothetical protein
VASEAAITAKKCARTPQLATSKFLIGAIVWLPVVIAAFVPFDYFN